MTAIGEAIHRIVIDANLFFLPPVRDFFLTGARESRLIEVRWSEEILAEVERNWTRVTGEDRAVERWLRLSAALERAFPDALVPTAMLPLAGYPGVDPADWHVVGTAMAAQATGIVTINRRHFPARYLAALGLQVWSPDELCLDLYQHAAERVLVTLVRQSAYLQRPRSLADTLAVLAPQCPRFIVLLRADLNLG